MFSLVCLPLRIYPIVKMYTMFRSVLISLLLFLHLVYSTLVSRHRYPQEYAANNLIDTEDIDPQTYEHLMQDLPQLRKMIQTGKLSYRRRDFDDDPNDGEYYEDEDVIEPQENATLDYASGDDSSYYMNATSTRMPFRTDRTQLQPTNQSRRFWSFWTPYAGTFVGKCYWCGLNVDGIPKSPLCHDVFESGDLMKQKYKTHYRAYCYYNQFHGAAHRKKTWWFGGYMFSGEAGLISQYYGRFHGGCFKRYLDVGTVYTQRGCRYWWPMMAWHIYGWWSRSKGRSFAAHRYRSLEAILKKYSNKCIVSPHASLTPFSRAISLYVRYHVCVCSKSYCNASIMSTPYLFSILCLVAIAFLFIL